MKQFFYYAECFVINRLYRTSGIVSADSASEAFNEARKEAREHYAKVIKEKEVSFSIVNFRPVDAF